MSLTRLETDEVAIQSPNGTETAAIKIQSLSTWLSLGWTLLAGPGGSGTTTSLAYLDTMTAAASYQPIVKTVSWSKKVAALGDSTTYTSEPWLEYAQTLSSGQIRAHQQVSYTGNTAAQVLSHVTDITTATDKADMCAINVGVNDAGAGTSAATFMVSVKAIVVALRAAGVQPVLCLLPPQNSAPRGVYVQQYNLALSRYAALNSIPCLDFYTPLADLTTGNYASGMTLADGIHPSPAGTRLWALAAVTALTQRSLPRAFWLPTKQGAGLASNPLMVDTNADGVPDGWSGTGTGITATTIAATATTPKWWRVAMASATGQKTWSGPALGTPSVGDRMLAVARVRKAGGTFVEGNTVTSATMQLSVINYNAGFTVIQNVMLTGRAGFTQAIDGVGVAEWVVPTGTTQLFGGYLTGQADDTYDLAQFEVYNLTTLGID